MSTTCAFDLGGRRKIYYSGDTVSGNIILHLAHPNFVEDIELVLHGEAKVSWNVEMERRRQNGSTYTETVEYSGDEVYVHTSQVLHSGGNIGPGELRLPFSLQLPENCHSALRRDYGSITYELSLTLDALNRFTTMICVYEKVDLNLHPTLRIPLQAEEIKTFCCSSGTLSYTFTVPFGGYVAHQLMPYSLQIENQSLTDTDGYTVSIYEETSYKVQRPEHDERSDSRQVYKRKYDDRCLRLSTRIFKDCLLMPLLVPNIQENGIIGLRYNLIVTVHFSGCVQDSAMCVPLHIGTIALRENPMDAPPLREDGGPPNYQYFKPPTFDEATAPSAPPEEAPPYESIADNSQRPFIGFRTLDEKVGETH